MYVKFYVESWSLPTIYPVSEFFATFVSRIFGSVTEKTKPEQEYYCLKVGHKLRRVSDLPFPWNKL